jgi:hypothetical protein
VTPPIAFLNQGVVGGKAGKVPMSKLKKITPELLEGGPSTVALWQEPRTLWLARTLFG